MTAMPTENEPQPPEPIILGAALRYASRGLRVINIHPGSKRPVGDNWPDRATTDTDTLRNWWKQNPDCGVGIATGWYGNRCIFVVDVDDGTDPHTGRIKQGSDTLADLEAQHGKLPDTVEGQSGGGGRHLFFWATVEIRNDQAGLLGPDLDLRGVGGQVVAEPTVHPDTGRSYVWVDGHDPVASKIAQAPSWLVDLLTAPPPEPRAERATYEGPPRPGDRFAAAVTWPDLLRQDGATFLGSRTDRATGHGYELWARPGADHTSATLYYAGTDVLKVFTSNWPGLTQGQTYTRFGYWTATRHNGNHSAAASVLARAQYEDDIRALVADTPPQANTGSQEPADGQPDEQDGEELPPGSVPAGRQTPAKIREAFWDSRETLDQIRAGARNTLVSPDAMLGAVLARIAWLLPPAVTLPPIIGGTRGSLNLLVALTGSPGAGKTVGVPASRTVIPQRPQDPYGFSCGFSTGQGAIEQYIGVVQELDPQTGKPVRRRVQTRYHGLFVVDEGSALTSLSARDGSIVWETIRSAWSGAELSTPNADEERRRHLPEHGYRFVLVVGLQPSAAAALLGDAALGGPQRFLWLDNDDPGAARHTEPGLPFDIDNRAEQFTVDQSIVDEIQDERVARLRSEVDVAELDTHRSQLRLRVAALLAAVENRRDVNREDWQLAEMVLEASDATRTSVSGHLAAEHDISLERRARDAARVAVRVRQAVDRDRTAVAITAAKVAAHIYSERREGCPEGVGHTTMCLRWVRPAKGSSMREAIAYALDEGWIERSGRRLVAGPNVPDEGADEGA